MIPFGTLVVYVTTREKRYIKRLEMEADWHSNEGTLPASSVHAANFGDVLLTNQGNPILVQEAGLNDLLLGLKRQTQIIYPKDIAYICLRLGAGHGRKIGETGCGSGALTLALSWFCGKDGQIVSQDAREEFARLCRRNLEWAGLGQNVEIFHRNLREGFAINNADALFLDLREPWLYLDQAIIAIKPGGIIGFLLPTMNQMEQLLLGLEKVPVGDVEISEILIRQWKPLPDRLRPKDRMTAHTGFLLFCRQQNQVPCSSSLGTRERKQKAAYDRRNENEAQT